MLAKRAGFLHGVAVELERRLAFVGEIGQLRHARLHAERQFVLLDARARFGIAKLLVVQLVERLEAVERLAADGRRHAGRIVDVQNRIAGRAERDAGVLARQIARLPQPGRDRLHLLGVRGPGDEDDERRQVVVERAQAVRSPRAEARPAGDLVAGLNVA